jgi:hypothetical protein
MAALISKINIALKNYDVVELVEFPKYRMFYDLSRFCKKRCHILYDSFKDRDNIFFTKDIEFTKNIKDIPKTPLYESDDINKLKDSIIQKKESKNTDRYYIIVSSIPYNLKLEFNELIKLSAGTNVKYIIFGRLKNYDYDTSINSKDYMIVDNISDDNKSLIFKKFIDSFSNEVDEYLELNVNNDNNNGDNGDNGYNDKDSWYNRLYKSASNWNMLYVINICVFLVILIVLLYKFYFANGTKSTSTEQFNDSKPSRKPSSRSINRSDNKKRKVNKRTIRKK